MVERGCRNRAGKAPGSRNPGFIREGIERLREGDRRPGHAAGLTLIAVAVAGLLLATAAVASDVPTQVLRDWMFCNNAGWRALERENYVYAEKQFLAAIKVIRPYQAKDQRLLARSYVDLARVLYHQGRFADAEPLAKWTLAVRQQHPRVKPDATFQALFLVSKIEVALKRPGEAEPLLRQALTIQETALGTQSEELCLTLEELAQVLRDEKKYAEAEKFYKRSLQIRSKSPGRSSEPTADTADRYAALLRDMNRLTEAEFQEARARTIRADLASAKKAATTRAAQTKAAAYRGFK